MRLLLDGLDALVQEFIDSRDKLPVVGVKSYGLVVDLLEENLFDLVHGVDY